MPNDNDLDNDDYVAKLLAEDARKSSAKYAAAGLSALLPKRSGRPGPRPNTRFLSHLVRDVDSHNTALKRKEELEAQTRLECIRKREREEERSRAFDLSRKRRRTDKDGHRSHHDTESRSHRRSGSPRHDRSNRQENKRRSRRTSPSSSGRHTEDDRERSNEKERRRRRSDRDQEHRSRCAKSPIHDEESTAKNGYRKHKSPGYHEREEDSIPPSKSSNVSSRRPPSAVSDSDPLEDLVGPLPASSDAGFAPRIRGRGAHKAAKSSMDEHFSASYDPTQDVNRDSEVDVDREDWDMALEALHDRTMWKRKQSERLREAGFGDEEIEKWEKGVLNADNNVVKDPRDVRWKRKGESREWDLGKKGFYDNDDEGDDDEHMRTRDTQKRQDEERSMRRKEFLEDGWKRKDSGLLRSFRKALG